MLSKQQWNAAARSGFRVRAVRCHFPFSANCGHFSTSAVGVLRLLSIIVDATKYYRIIKAAKVTQHASMRLWGDLSKQKKIFKPNSMNKIIFISSKISKDTTKTE